ncbi:hypothetical protein E2C01_076971 [Portunus trituberculatus]|uniref:Uncharacterized protein n=1 Tax=Portunus trituberculatus TaxID=210409 RepID=A0A5B7IJ65_PORTR|nr:hypothetical protein [Portunus trituberculatus]
MEDLRSLSQYLNTQLLQSRKDSITSSSSSHSSYLSRFVGKGVTPCLEVHVRDESGELQPHHLLLYSLMGVTICLTFAGNDEG